MLRPTPEQLENMMKKAAENRAREGKDMYSDGEDKDELLTKSYPYPPDNANE